jgi:hypothetical protein
MIRSLSSDNGFKELGHNVKKLHCVQLLCSHCRNSMTCSRFNMERHSGDLHIWAVSSDDSCFHWTVRHRCPERFRWSDSKDQQMHQVMVLNCWHGIPCENFPPSETRRASKYKPSPCSLRHAAGLLFTVPSSCSPTPSSRSPTQSSRSPALSSQSPANLLHFCSDLCGGKFCRRGNVKATELWGRLCLPIVGHFCFTFRYM